MSLFLRISAATCVVLLASGGASAQQASCTGNEGPVRLYVDVEGVRKAEGLIAVTVYADDSKRFLAKRGSLYVGRTPATAPTTRACIYLPSTGVYALGVYHDADGDRSIDRNAIGLPTEAVGFSNNPRLILSIPAFRSVRLSVPRNNMRTTIRLRYP
jgi:uncharacterized protein (DUF2141 family)